MTYGTILVSSLIQKEMKELENVIDSEHESVLEKFDNMLDLYAHVYFISDKKKTAIRDRVLRMPYFDTLEFRVLNGDIQFRQRRDGGWMTLVL